MIESIGVAPLIPDPDIVDILEDCLQRAKAGTLVSLAVATVDAGGLTWQGYSAAEYKVRLMGSLTLCSHKVAIAVTASQE